jgi:hypothetical protein
MQVGFSFSDVKDDYNTDDTQTASDNVAALIAFMHKFPEHSSDNLYLTGESYAGHYVPTLAKAILDHNAQSSPKLNLQGFAVGNPLTNEPVRARVPPFACVCIFPLFYDLPCFSPQNRTTSMRPCPFTSTTICFLQHSTPLRWQPAKGISAHFLQTNNARMP